MNEGRRSGEGRVGVNVARDERTDASEGVYWTPAAGKTAGSSSRT